jgi:pantothenate kinase
MVGWTGNIVSVRTVGRGMLVGMMPTAPPDLVQAARQMMQPGSRRMLGIVGAPGAGKSTLALALQQALAPLGEGLAVVVPMDGFHLAQSELQRLGRAERKGAPDTFDAAGYAALLQRLRTDTAQTVYAPAFERGLEEPIAGAIAVPPNCQLVITEGNYLLLDSHGWQPVRGLLDDAWFLDLPPHVRLPRLKARHEAHGRSAAQAEAWMAQTDEPNARLIEASRGRASRCVSWHAF